MLILKHNMHSVHGIFFYFSLLIIFKNRLVWGSISRAHPRSINIDHTENQMHYSFLENLHTLKMNGVRRCRGWGILRLGCLPWPGKSTSGD